MEDDQDEHPAVSYMLGKEFGLGGILASKDPAIAALGAMSQDDANSKGDSSESGGGGAIGILLLVLPPLYPIWCVIQFAWHELSPIVGNDVLKGSICTVFVAGWIYWLTLLYRSRWKLTAALFTAIYLGFTYYSAFVYVTKDPTSTWVVVTGLAISIGGYFLGRHLHNYPVRESAGIWKAVKHILARGYFCAFSLIVIATTVISYVDAIDAYQRIAELGFIKVRSYYYAYRLEPEVYYAGPSDTFGQALGTALRKKAGELGERPEDYSTEIEIIKAIVAGCSSGDLMVPGNAKRKPLDLRGYCSRSYIDVTALARPGYDKSKHRGIWIATNNTKGVPMLLGVLFARFKGEELIPTSRFDFRYPISEEFHSRGILHAEVDRK